jgi:hypothetical protein
MINRQLTRQRLHFVIADRIQPNGSDVNPTGPGAGAESGPRLVLPTLVLILGGGRLLLAYV